MTTATTPKSSPKSSVDALLLDVSHAQITVTPEHFDQLCIDNPDLRLELTKDGELIVMAPAGGESSRRNLRLATDVDITRNAQSDVFIWRCTCAGSSTGANSVGA